MSTRTLGFILHRFPFQDADLILKVFTPNHGVISVLAKGAKRSKSGAHFEPFMPIEIEFLGKSELKKLKSIEFSQAEVRGFKLKGDRLYSGFYLNELLMYLIPPSFSSALNLSDFFNQYEKTLSDLSVESFSLEGILREFEIELFKTLGLWPDLTRDDHGKPLHPDDFYLLSAESLPKKVEAGQGGFIGRDLLNIAVLDWTDTQTLRAAKRLLRHWVSFYAEGKVFKSRECFSGSL